MMIHQELPPNNPKPEPPLQQRSLQGLQHSPMLILLSYDFLAVVIATAAHVVAAAVEEQKQEQNDKPQNGAVAVVIASAVSAKQIKHGCLHLQKIFYCSFLAVVAPAVALASAITAVATEQKQEHQDEKQDTVVGTK